MLTIAPGWELAVQRGPDWVCVHVQSDADAAVDEPPLADRLWALLEQHSTYRLLLDLDDVDEIDDYLIGELLQVHHRVRARGGVMRLCSTTGQHGFALRARGLDDLFVLYRSRDEAMHTAWRPERPR